MPKLNIIFTSTREGRGGLPVGQWFDAQARKHGGFDVEFIDLAEVNLPLFDEPRHPMLQQYEHEHTKAWAESVASAQAYVFVLPEYNYFPPPTFFNALDFVSKEWNYKPAGFVTYGGISAGTRSQQMARLAVTSAKMMPMVEAVNFPFYHNSLEENVLQATEQHEAGAKKLLDEMLRWSNALAVLR